MTKKLLNTPRMIAAAAVIGLGLTGTSNPASADSGHRAPVSAGGAWTLENGELKPAPLVDDHAPIGVMGEHRHKPGQVMFSYRFMRMWMEDNLIGEDEVDPAGIAANVANPFFGNAPFPTGVAPNMRIVPINMRMDMHMFGAMYGLTDRITLMGMVPYIEKSMEHLTFLGPRGTALRGAFATASEGFGDISGTASIGLIEQEAPDRELHVDLMLGLSAPTGSTSEADDVLTPIGTRPTVRLPYPMQIGSGTWDFLPGVLYTQREGKLSWGAQWRGTIRLEDSNDDGYSLGDKHMGTAWAAYRWLPWMSSSLRVMAQTMERIDGQDPLIVAPVQTANPQFQGGDRVDLLLGVNLIARENAGWLCGHRLALEAGMPVHQDLNGPQLATDWTFTVGWQKTWHDC